MWRRFMVHIYYLLVEAYLGEAEKQINLELNWTAFNLDHHEP